MLHTTNDDPGENGGIISIHEDEQLVPYMHNTYKGLKIIH